MEEKDKELFRKELGEKKKNEKQKRQLSFRESLIIK